MCLYKCWQTEATGKPNEHWFGYLEVNVLTIFQCFGYMLKCSHLKYFMKTLFCNPEVQKTPNFSIRCSPFWTIPKYFYMQRNLLRSSVSHSRSIFNEVPKCCIHWFPFYSGAALKHESKCGCLMFLISNCSYCASWITSPVLIQEKTHK